MNINLENYRIFYSVAKNKNITKASKELLISQPGVSKAIKNLEEQINCQLFIRSKNGVVLTHEGEIFFEEIKKAMEMVKNAEERLQESINLESGYLKIGISNTLVQNYLLPYLEKYHQLYPNIKINVFTDQTKELIDKVLDCRLDFIILNMPYQIDKSLKVEKLKDVEDIFVVGKKYYDLTNKAIDLDTLNNYPLILLPKESSTRRFLDDFLIKRDIYLNAEMELTSSNLVTEFTKIGLGIGYTTKEFIQKDLDNNELYELKVTPKIPMRYIGICYKDTNISMASKEFMKLLGL